MTNIENVIDDLLKKETDKNIRIHFPNGERPDIVNENILGESVSLTESLCSQELKFGLCEATVFEAELFDIEKKYINVKDASGAFINVSDSVEGRVLEVDIAGKSEQHTTTGGLAMPNTIYPQEIKSVGDCGSLNFILMPDSDYEAAVKTQITINEGLPYRGINAVVDRVISKSGVYGKEETLKKVVLTSTTDVRFNHKNASTVCMYHIPYPAIKINGEIMCNRLPRGKSVYSDEEVIVSHGSFATVYFVLKFETLGCSGTETGTVFVQKFKEWIERNHTEYLYEMSTPIWIPFTNKNTIAAFQNLYSFNGITNVYTTDDLQPDIKITYESNSGAIGSRQIENPYPLLGKIKGCEIEVFLEVDLSSESEELIKRFGSKKNDVAFPFFRIPYFKGVIYESKKQSNMEFRKIVAYDRLNESIFEKNIIQWIRLFNIDRAKFVQSRPNKYSYETPPSKKIKHIYEDLLNYYGIATEKETVINSGELIVDENDIIQDGWKYGRRYKVIRNLTNNKYYDLNIGEFYYGTSNYVLNAGCVRTKEKLNLSGYIKVLVEFDMEKVRELNTVLNEYEKTNKTVQERLYECKELPSSIGGTVLRVDDEIGSAEVFSYIDNAFSIETVISTEDIPSHNRNNHIAYFGKMIIEKVTFKSSTPSGGAGYEKEIVKEINIVKSIKVVQVQNKAEFINGDVDLKIEYYKETDSLNIDNTNLSLRNMISSILEINGLFGAINNIGNFETIKLGTPHFKVEKTLKLSANWKLNYSESNRINEEEQTDIWYDDELVGGYKKISVETAGEEVIEFSGSGNGGTYKMTENILLCNSLYGKSEVMEIIRKLFERIRNVKYIPLSGEVHGNPFIRKKGDEIFIKDEDKEIGTYIFKRSMKGLQAITEEIDSEN